MTDGDHCPKEDLSYDGKLSNCGSKEIQDELTKMMGTMGLEEKKRPRVYKHVKERDESGNGFDLPIVMRGKFEWKEELGDPGKPTKSILKEPKIREKHERCVRFDSNFVMTFSRDNHAKEEQVDVAVSSPIPIPLNLQPLSRVDFASAMTGSCAVPSYISNANRSPTPRTDQGATSSTSPTPSPKQFDVEAELAKMDPEYRKSVEEVRHFLGQLKVLRIGSRVTDEITSIKEEMPSEESKYRKRCRKCGNHKENRRRGHLGCPKENCSCPECHVYDYFRWNAKIDHARIKYVEYVIKVLKGAVENPLDKILKEFDKYNAAIARDVRRIELFEEKTPTHVAYHQDVDCEHIVVEVEGRTFQAMSSTLITGSNAILATTDIVPDDRRPRLQVNDDVLMIYVEDIADLTSKGNGNERLAVLFRRPECNENPSTSVTTSSSVNEIKENLRQTESGAPQTQNNEKFGSILEDSQHSSSHEHRFPLSNNQSPSSHL